MNNSGLRPVLLVLTLLVAASLGRAQSAGAPSLPNERAVSASAVMVVRSSVQPSLSGAAFSGWCAYSIQGTGKLVSCNMAKIKPSSRVFASISEYYPAPANRFIGGARMTIHNLSPRNGGFEAWIDVEWASPLKVRLDVLVDP